MTAGTTTKKITLTKHPMHTNLSLDEMKSTLEKTLKELQNSQIGNRNVAQRDLITKLVNQVHSLIYEIYTMSSPSLTADKAQVLTKKGILQAVYTALLTPSHANYQALDELSFTLTEPTNIRVGKRIYGSIVPYIASLHGLGSTPNLIPPTSATAPTNSTSATLLNDEDSINTRLLFLDKVSKKLQETLTNSTNGYQGLQVNALCVNVEELINLITKNTRDKSQDEEAEIKRVLTAVYTTMLYPTPANCKALQKISTQVSGHENHFWKKVGLILQGIVSVLLGLTIILSPLAAESFCDIKDSWKKFSQQGLSLATQKVVTQIENTNAIMGYRGQFFQNTEKVDQTIADEVRSAASQRS